MKSTWSGVGGCLALAIFVLIAGMGKNLTTLAGVTNMKEWLSRFGDAANLKGRKENYE